MSNRKKIFRRVVACAVIAAIEMEAMTLAHADMNTEMKNMWNTTQAQAYSNSRGMGVFGGSMSIRAPVRSFTIIAYDPPHMEFGCAGIDVHFGAFSMLNGEQIKVLTRAIVQSAAIYLVHLAIESICKPCENQLSKFNRMVQDLASLRRNTCQLGTEIGKAIAKDVGYVAPSQKQSNRTDDEGAKAVARGTLTDEVASWWNQYQNGSTSQRDASKNDDTGYGNILVNSMFTSGSFDNFNVGVLGGYSNTVSFMMSIFGTEVVSTEKGTVTAGTGAQTQTTTSTQSNPDLNFHNSTMRAVHLRNGSTEEPAPIVRVCKSIDLGVGLSCQGIDNSPMNFPGLSRYVLEMVAGHQPSLSGEFMGVQPGSIAAKIKNGELLDTQELTFLRAFSINSGMLLTEAAGMSGSTYDSLVERIINIMADEITVSVGRAMIRTVNASFPDTTTQNGTRALPMPIWMKENVQNFQTQLNELVPEAQRKIFEEQVRILDMMRSIRHYSSPNVAGGKR